MTRISAELIGSADTGDDRARNITRKNFPILMASLQGESQRGRRLCRLSIRVSLENPFLRVWAGILIEAEAFRAVVAGRLRAV
jgi:hypothetical protein